MANLRILYENAVDSSDFTIGASNTASVGGLIANNLRSDIKSKVHRANGSAVTYTMTWLNARVFSVVALLFTNLTSNSLIRVRAYAQAADLLPVYDSSYMLGCQGAPLGAFAWGQQPLGVNAYRFGGYSHARLYFPAVAARKIIVDVDDSANPSGYVEISRMACGHYWAPETNADYGMQLRYEYNSEHELSDAGDLRTERRPVRRAMNFDLNWLKDPGDQLTMHEMLMNNAMARPVFISLFPEDENPMLEQRHQMYAKIDGDTAMTHPSFGVFSVPLAFRET